SWTVLGVGNRRGILTMLIGCTLIAIGLLYAFYVKPVLKRFLKEKYAMLAESQAGRTPPVRVASRGETVGASGWMIGAAVSLALAATSGAVLAQEDGDPLPSGHPPIGTMPNASASHAAEPADPAAQAVMRRRLGVEAEASLQDMAASLDLEAFRLLVVQHSGRYQTVEAWARDITKKVHGRKGKLFDVDPVVAALELCFNPSAHVEQIVIHLKDIGIRHDITAHPVELSDVERRRIRRTGMVSYHFMHEPAVTEVLAKLKTQVPLQRAIDRTETAVFFFEAARRTLRILPSPSGTWDSQWHTIDELLANARIGGHDFMGQMAPVAGVEAAEARDLLELFAGLGVAWQNRDAATINEKLASLSERLPTLAPDGVYMTLSQRKVEAFYHRMNAFTWGWGIYILGLAVSIWAVVTRWRAARAMATGIFLIALLLHGFGLGLRWYILGRIPVANMFEAVVGSAWLGALIALGLEWRLIRAFQVVYLIPMTFAVILVQRYDTPMWFAFAGVATVGLLADIVYVGLRRRRGVAPDDATLAGRGYYVLAACFLGFLSLALGTQVGAEITTIAGILDDVLLRIHTVLIIVSYAIVTLAFGVANCYLIVRAFKTASGVAWATIGCEIGGAVGLWAALDGKLSPSPDAWLVVTAVTLAMLGGGVIGWAVPQVFAGLMRPALSGGPAGAPFMSGGRAVSRAAAQSPLLSGLDLSQMTLLHMANVGLFVGVILGAVWADYSWGRPWGWDPKEVFALNTWLIYAILIHVRMLSRDKGLWTAVVACIGFAMMMFNWWAVNFYIVGLHSYA
ncbi:MAG: cytochrome c biogenesis protein CcsA, partial [Phycisphaerae bacterium]